MVFPLEKAPVSEKALIARVNRALAKENKRLCVARHDTRMFDNFGRYYIVSGNTVVDGWFKLDSYARRLELMADYEELE